MTGPEHYREAEKRIAEFNRGEATAEDIAVAQVHATLALAAATAMAAHVDSNGPGMHRVDFRAWDTVAGETE